MRSLPRHLGLEAAALCMLASLPSSAEVIDRIVAIVGDQEIAASDVDRQLRLEALFGDRPIEEGAEERRQALERLIDQTLIAGDVMLSGLPALSERERQEALEQIERTGFGSSGFHDALRNYRVSIDDVARFLEAQIQFTRYLAFRFRTGQIITDEEIEAAYRAQYGDSATPPPLDTVRERLREATLDERATSLLEERVRQMRAETRVVLLDPLERTLEPTP